MPEYVLNRNHVLQGGGHTLNFIKGKPMHVPPCLERAAAAIGAECAEGGVDPLGPEAVVTVPLGAEERQEALVSAIELLCERNNTDDFGGDNRPSLAALQKIVEFTTSKKERDVAWNSYKAKLAE